MSLSSYMHFIDVYVAICRMHCIFEFVKQLACICVSFTGLQLTDANVSLFMFACSIHAKAVIKFIYIIFVCDSFMCQILCTVHI